MALVRRYQQTRLALLDDLARQSEKLELATGLGGLAIAGVGAYAVASGWIAPTLLPLLILISVAAFLPVSEIAQVGRQLADTIASTRRLHVVHSEPVRIVDGPLEPPVAARRFVAAVRRASASPIRGAARPALSDVSFEVAAGSTVALVGPSGAGKTTVANLLLRFWDPDEGSVRLAGMDLRKLTLDGLRQRIALVAQDTYLFNDTLEANIRLARPGASQAAIDAGAGAGGAVRVRRESARRSRRRASASAASSSPAASASASRSRGRSSRTRRSWSSTKPRRISTR